MTILELPQPRQDADDPHGLKILPYVVIHTLEQLADGVPAEYVPHLVAAVDAIKSRHAAAARGATHDH